MRPPIHTLIIHFYNKRLIKQFALFSFYPSFYTSDCVKAIVVAGYCNSTIVVPFNTQYRSIGTSHRILMLFFISLSGKKRKIEGAYLLLLLCIDTIITVILKKKH